MKGVTEISAELSPEVSPVFILEAERPEWEFLKGEKLMASVFSVTGVAAVNSAYRLVNPATSGVIAIITDIFFFVDVNGAVSIFERNATQGNLAAILPTVSRDSRLPILNASSCIASVATNIAASGEAFIISQILANTREHWQPNYVMGAGQQLQISTTGVNITLRGAVWWKERRLDVLEEA